MLTEGQNVPYSRCLASSSVMSINLVKWIGFMNCGAVYIQKIVTLTLIVSTKCEPAVYLRTKSGSQASLVDIHS